MSWYDSKRMVSIIILFFGIAALVNTAIGSFEIPNTLILGVLLLLFGRQMYQEAELDKMEESAPAKTPTEH